jgi:hypothetical protein
LLRPVRRRSVKQRGEIMAEIGSHGLRWIRALAWKALTTPAACAACAMLASSAAAQAPRGSVTGIVRDSAGHAVIGAQLNVVGTDIRTSSDVSGHYLLAGVWPDDVTVAVRRLGFAPESVTTRVEPGQQATANFHLNLVAVQLASQPVTGDREHGRMSSFYRRKSNGVGAFITREQIEKRNPGRLSEMLRNVAGVGVAQPLFGKPERIHMDRSIGSTEKAGCVVQLYIDGLPYPQGHVDDFPPETVEGMEIYRSASEIPPDFRTRDASCGVIAIWSRDPATAGRQP